jgi:hypothetical protein
VRRPVAQYNPDVKTAVILVNGFSSIGLQTLRNVIDFFGAPFQNFVFVNVGVVDARRFKGKEEIENLRLEIENELNYYLRFVSELGLFGEGVVSIGTDVVSEVNEWVPRILSEYPNAVFFGGFLVFKEESLFSRALHNHTIFILQQQLTMQIVPIPILVT